MATATAAIETANGIAGLFNAAITWFDYIYVAKNTWPKLQTLFLQLDNAQLRLTRWGEAAGLSGPNIYSEESAKFSGSFALIGKQETEAIKIFTVICNRFTDCQRICHSFRNGKDENDPAVKHRESQPSEAPWLPMNKYLHDAMQVIVNGRKNKIPVHRKLRFAIYDEKHLKDLVKDINDHVDSLYKIIPPPDSKQAELSKDEVAQFLKGIERFGEIIKTRDELLGSAIQSIVNQKASTIPHNDLVMNFENNDSNVAQMGQMNGGTTTQTNYKGGFPVEWARR